MQATNYSKRSRPHVDFFLIIIPYMIAVIGIICISIAMYKTSEEGKSLLAIIMSSRSGQMQLLWFAVSIPVFIAVQMIPMELIRTRYYVAYIGVVVLLFITLVLSKAVNGINSWLQTGFGRAIQPAEFAKLAVLVLLAKKLSDRESPFKSLRGWITMGILVGAPVLIVLAQGETGSVIVIGAMLLVMLALSNTNKYIVLSSIGLLILAIIVLFGYAKLSNSTDYRIVRILAFTDPQAYSEGGGYQLLQSQKAVGAGQLTGIGFYKPDSMATLGFVPESSTDFIFSIIGESTGFVGSTIVLLLYLTLFIHMLYEGRYTTDVFSRMIIYGVMSMLAFHVFENVGMVIGVLPITGIPLPFISYGGSSFLTNIIGVAMAFGAIRQRSTLSYEGLQLGDPNWTTDALRLPTPREMREEKERRKDERRAAKAALRANRRSIGEVWFDLIHNKSLKNPYAETMEYRRRILKSSASDFRRFIDKIF